MAAASLPELAEQFKTEAVRVGAIVYQAGDAGDAADYVLKIAREHNVKRVVKSRSTAAEEIGLNKYLEDAGIELVETGVERWIARRSILNADMGISGANIAVAETGTLVVMDGEGNARLVATFPPLHMALVGCEKLVSTLGDATRIVKALVNSGEGGKMPRYITHITGQSTTADIPGAPLLPAQGPGEVHIVLLDSHKPAGEFDPETYRLP
jgi:L-lactate utilization protein LutB